MLFFIVTTVLKYAIVCETCSNLLEMWLEEKQHNVMTSLDSLNLRSPKLSSWEGQVSSINTFVL